MLDKLNKVADGLTDTWEDLTSDQTSRTGHSAARIASALANGVDPEVIALQMTKNSQKNNPDNPVQFTGSEMPVIAKLHQANQTRSAFPKQQAGALVREQKAADQEGKLLPE